MTTHHRAHRWAAIAAFLVLGTGAVALLWPRHELVTEWDDADLEPVATADDDRQAELSTSRTEVGPDDQDAGPLTEPHTPLGSVADLTLRGRVVDRQGTPVAGALVRLELAGSERERMRKPTPTAADGTFAFRGPMRPGRAITLLATHPDFAPAQVGRHVPAGGDPPLVADIVLGRGGTVRGSVVLEGGGAAGGAEVRLLPESGVGALWSGALRNRLDAEAPSTDGAGLFQIERLPPGGYRVTVRAPGRVAANSDGFLVVEGGVVTLPPISLAPGCTLAGRVMDRHGRGVAKARVAVTHLPPPASPQQRAVTGTDGSFVIDNLAPRPSDLHVFAPGFVSHQRRIDLARERSVEIVLDDGLRIAGRVRDAATGAAVLVFAVRARRVQDSAKAAPAPRQADDLPQDAGPPIAHPDGTFVCDGLDGGVYAIDVKAEGFVAARSEPIELHPETPTPMVEVALERGHRLRGLVTGAAEGAPIAGARIEVLLLPPAAAAPERPRGPTVATAISGADGSFAIDNVRAGRCVLRTSAAGHAAVVGEPFQVAGDVDGLRVVLAAQARLFGSVRGIPRGREPDVTVVAFATHRNIKTARVASDGRYDLGELPPTGYHVRAFLADASTAIRRLAEALGGEPATMPDVQLRSGEDRDLPLQLELVATGSLHGQATVNGAPAVGFQLRLEPPGQPARRFLPTVVQQVEVDGTFAFRDVEAGTYDLVLYGVARARIALARRPVDVRADTDDQVAIDVDVAAVEGEVVAPEDGTPVDGIVKLHPASGRGGEFTARVHAGRFRIDVLPAGSWVLEHVLEPEREGAREELTLARGERRRLVLTAGRKR